MPLAKVIPIVNGLIFTVLADAPNPFVQVTWDAKPDFYGLLIVFIAQTPVCVRGVEQAHSVSWLDGVRGA